MDILVCVKAVPDFDQIAPSGRLWDDDFDPLKSVDDDSELYMNRFDEPAVEEAVLIKEALSETTIDIVSVGPEGAQKAIKRAIGMGADSGTHIQTNYEAACNAMHTARAIAEFAGRKSYDLIFTGVMSEDMMQFQVGPMLAQYLNIPWKTAVIRQALDAEKARISVEQEIEGGAGLLWNSTCPPWSPSKPGSIFPATRASPTCFGPIKPAFRRSPGIPPSRGTGRLRLPDIAPLKKNGTDG